MSNHKEMTRYAFISHMEDYMKQLLKDPLHADTDEFLNNDQQLADPFELPDMEKAVERILQAIENDEIIAVCGDYDADGVTASSLLYLYLKNKGNSVK